MLLLFLRVIHIRLDLVVDKHSAVVDVSGVEFVDGLLETVLGHGELLDDRLDVVQGSELEHLVVDGAVSDDGTLDVDTVGEQWHVWHLELVIGDGQGEDGRSHAEHGDDLLPIGLGRGGNQKSVDLVLGLEVLVEVGGSNELAGSELHGLLLLAVGSGDDDDSASELGSELNGEVTQSTYTHDTDDVRRLEALEGGEYGGSTTLLSSAETRTVI